MNRRGVAFMQFEHFVEWEQVRSLDLAGALFMDPHHFSHLRTLMPQGFLIYRPTEPYKPLWEKFTNGYDWAWEIVTTWPWSDPPDAVQFLNEPNVPAENGGFPVGSLDVVGKIVEWGRSVANNLRTLWPSVQVVSPPLSPAPGYKDLEFLKAMRPLVEACDLLGAHCYWVDPQKGLYGDNRDNAAFRYRQYRALFPDKEVVVAEFNRPHYGKSEFGEEADFYTTHLDGYVRLACAFVWDAPTGLFEEYVLEGTGAQMRWAELVRPERSEFTCPKCGAKLRVVGE